MTIDAESGRLAGALRRLRALRTMSRYRYFHYDVVVLALVLAFAAFVRFNVSSNLDRLHIGSGFSFLQGQQAGFGISETLIDYDSQSSYGRAILVGLLNTLMVSALAIGLSTILGTIIGVMRLGSSRLIAFLARSYVEVFRNTPLLLQLTFWYALILLSLPNPKNTSPILGVALFTNRGLFLPAPTSSSGFLWLYAGAAISLAMALGWRRFTLRRQRETGHRWPVALPVVLVALATLSVTLLACGATLGIDWPRPAGFRVVGGISLSPELTTLVGGLTFYTSALIAEIVRSGIMSVEKAQVEAARAMGLHEWQTLRLVTLPLAVRVIIPPTISQYLSLVKNSSLAVAIGFPEIASITNTIINQTGQAIEGIAILMGTYLTISLSISTLMNILNARLAVVRR